MSGDKKIGPRKAYGFGARGEALPQDVGYGRIAEVAYWMGVLLKGRDQLETRKYLEAKEKEYQRLFGAALSTTSGVSRHALQVLQNAATFFDGHTPRHHEFPLGADRVEWSHRFAFANTEAARGDDTTATWLITDNGKTPSIDALVGGRSREFPVQDIEILYSAPTVIARESGMATVEWVDPGTTHIFINRISRRDVSPDGTSGRAYRDYHGRLIPNTDNGLDGSFSIDIDASGRCTRVSAGRNNLSHMSEEARAEIDIAGFLTKLNSAIYETSQALPRIQ